MLSSTQRKKLDPSLLSSHLNLRIIVLKILAKIVAKQFHAVLDKYSVLHKFKSGFHRAQEAAHLRVSSDILMQSDAGECFVLLTFVGPLLLTLLTIALCSVG